MIANIFGVDGGIVVVIAIIVLVGGSQLPKIARNVGLAGKEFRKAQEESEAEAQRDKAKNAASVTPPPPQPLTPVAPTTEESVTLSRSELDALLKAREEQTRREAAGPTA